MKKNSFKELESVIIKDRSEQSKSTKQNVQSNIDFFKLVGDIVELYGPNFPKVLQSFVSVKNESTDKIVVNSSSDNTSDL